MGAGALTTVYVDFRAGLASLEPDLKQLSKKLNTTARDFEKIGKSLTTAFSIPLAAVGKKIFDASDSYQKATNTIRAQTGATGKTLQDLRADFDAVAGTVPNALSETGKAISQVYSRTQQTGKGTQDLTRTFLQLSNLTESDLNVTLQKGLQLFDTWGVATEDQIPVLNELYRAVQVSGGSLTDLLTNVGGADAVLGAFGFTLEETIALFASFERGGVDSGGAIASLTKALKYFSEAGVKDPKKALGDLILAIQKAPNDIKVIKAAYEILGKGARDFIDAITEGRFNYDAYLKVITGGTDTIAQASEDTKTFGKSISEAFNKASIDVAKALGPEAFKSLSDAIALLGQTLTSVIEHFVKLPLSVQALTIGLLSSITVLGPFVILLGQVASIGGVAVKWIADLAKSYKTLAPVAQVAATEVAAAGQAVQLSFAGMETATVAATATTGWTAFSAVATTALAAVGAAFGLFVGASVLSGMDLQLVIKGLGEVFANGLGKLWEGAIKGLIWIWENFKENISFQCEVIRDVFIWLLENFGLGPEQIEMVTRAMSETWDWFTKKITDQIELLQRSFRKLGDGWRVLVYKLGDFTGSESLKKAARDAQMLAWAGDKGAAAFEEQKKKIDETNKSAEKLNNTVNKPKPGLKPPPTPDLDGYLKSAKKSAEEAAKAIADIGKGMADSKAAAEIDKIKDSIDAITQGVGDKAGLGSKANLTSQYAALEQKLRDKEYADQKANLDKLSGQQLADAKKIIDEKIAYDLQKYQQDLAPKLLETDRKNHKAAVAFYQGLMEDAITGTRFDWVAQGKKAAAEIAAEFLANMLEANLLASKSFADFFGKITDALTKGIGSWAEGTGIGDALGISDVASTITSALSSGGVSGIGPIADGAAYAASLEKATAATTLATKATSALTAALPWAGVAAVGAAVAYNNYDKFSSWNSNTTDNQKGANVATSAIDSVFPGVGTLIDQMLSAVGISFGNALTKNQQSLKGFEKFVEEALKKSLGVALNFAVGDINKFDQGGWADQFWADFGDVGADTFSTLGTAFEKMLGLEKGVGGQIGALLAENLAGATSEDSLNNIALFLDAIGVSAEQLTQSLLDMAKAGNITWFEFESMRQSLEKIPTEGLAGFGDIVGALEQVTSSGGRGINALNGLRNIAIEAGEAGVTSLAGLQQYLLDAGADAEVVQALFTALGQRGISSLEDLKNAADPALGGVIADMQTLGVKWEDFAESTEQLEGGIKNLADAIRELSGALNSIPDKIDTEINIDTNSAEDLSVTANRLGAVMKFARGGVVRRPTLFPVNGGNLGLMGEAGAEGILPLAQVNGKLGVHATGINGGGGNIVINIDATGAKAGVENDIMNAMAAISADAINASVAAMRDSNRRGSY